MDPEDPDDPNHSQNLITSSLYQFGHILKILSKSVHKFLSYLVHKQTDEQTNPGENITSLAAVINIGGREYGVRHCILLGQESAVKSIFLLHTGPGNNLERT